MESKADSRSGVNIAGWRYTVRKHYQMDMVYNILLMATKLNG